MDVGGDVGPGGMGIAMCGAGNLDAGVPARVRGLGWSSANFCAIPGSSADTAPGDAVPAVGHARETGYHAHDSDDATEPHDSDNRADFADVVPRLLQRRR